MNLALSILPLALGAAVNAAPQAELSAPQVQLSAPDVRLSAPAHGRPLPLAAVQQGGGLWRVAPGARSAGKSQAPRSQELFDADGWRDRLTAQDLDARMFSFEQLAELAARDDQARRQVDEWARGGEVELAWTARMIQRELEHVDGARGMGFAPRGLWRIDPFDDEALGDLHRRLDSWLRAPSMRSLPQWGGALRPGSRSSSQTRLEVTPDGVKLEVTEDVDGQPTTREYSAPSLEDLLEAHPELKDRIDLQLDADAPALRFGPQLDWFFDDAREAPRELAPKAETRTGGQPRTDILGVVLESLDADERQSMALDAGVGLRVMRVEPGTIAERLGLQRGHVLIELDGAPLRSRDDVTRRIQAREPNAEVKAVYVDRWGQRHEASWRPDARAEPRADSSTPTRQQI